MAAPSIPPSFEELAAHPLATVVDALVDPRYQQLRDHANAKYWPWRKVRIVAEQWGLDAALAWLVIVKAGRLAHRRVLPLRSKLGEELWFTVPPPLEREMMHVDRDLAGRITIDDRDALTGEQRDRFIMSALMDEAIASSLVEGASTTVRVAKELLRSGREPRTKSERMIANNFAAMKRMKEHVEADLTIDFILEIQEILTQGTLDDGGQAGRLRRPGEDVVVEGRDGEIVHVPPDASELPACLEALCRFASEKADDDDELTFVHPLVRAMVVHFQLAYDHPFCDGNGRTARALFYWTMLRNGYWLFEFLAISHLIYESAAQYGHAFVNAEQDGFDVTYFLVYHARVTRLARRRLQRFVEEKQREIAEARRRFKDEPGLNVRQHAILMHAVDHPEGVYTFESHQRSHGVAYATARSDLLDLEHKGFLVRRTSGRRFQFVPGPRLRS